MAPPARLGGRWLALAAAALLLAGLARAQSPQPTTWKCRMAPKAAHSGCGLPYELSNFQNSKDLACDKAVKVGRPQSLEDLKARRTGGGWHALVTMFPRVKAVGGGDSWWKEQFCAGNDSNSINIVMTELTPTLNQILQPVDPSYWVNRTIPADFPIQARIFRPGGAQRGAPPLPRAPAAPLSQRPSAPHPHTHTHRVQVDEDAEEVTVAGGVPQRVLLDYLAEYKYWKQPSGWSLQEPSFFDFAKQIKSVQDEYTAAKTKGDVDGMRQALFQVDETQTFWWFPNQQMWRTDYEYSDKEPLGVLLNIDTEMLEPQVSKFDGPADSAVFQQASKGSVPANRGLVRPGAARRVCVCGTFETRKAYMSMTEGGASLFTVSAPYDQLEVGAEIYGEQRLWDGFRTPALIRFTPGEDFYLSNANGRPTMWINLEDYITRSNGGRRNDKWYKVIQLFRDRCQARLHWGKYGWNAFSKCFDGSKEYPDTWCDFGCAVQELDPTGKASAGLQKAGGRGGGGRPERPEAWPPPFASISDVWQWQATRGGQSVPFASCCSPVGFNKASCTCAPRADGCKP
eukprot:scaffold1.g5590.t1